MAFNANNVYAEQEELSPILRMLVGLRKSWASTAHVAREGSAEYSTQGQGIDKAHDKARDKEQTSLFWTRPRAVKKP